MNTCRFRHRSSYPGRTGGSWTRLSGKDVTGPSPRLPARPAPNPQSEFSNGNSDDRVCERKRGLLKYRHMAAFLRGGIADMLGTAFNTSGAGHLNRGFDGILEIVRVVRRRFVSIAEIYSIPARAHLAQSEPEMARDRLGLLERHGFVELVFGRHPKGGNRFFWRTVS